MSREARDTAGEAPALPGKRKMQAEKSQREAFGIDGWRPGFVDYLFVAFTTSSTFGPTDAPILQPWAKLFAMLQAFISLTIVVLLISRAVGVL